MKALSAAGIVAILMLGSGHAHAGPYGDDLSKCLVSSATTADKSLLVKWIFSAISLHKDVAAHVSMPQDDRDALNKDTAGVYMRLMTDSCKNQLHDAYKYEGTSAIGTAFQLLGQVATQEMFSDPAVAAGTTDLMKYFDEGKLKAVLDAK